MLKVHTDSHFFDNPSCVKSNVNNFTDFPILFFDKDGYELTDLEMLLYDYNGFNLESVLNKKLLCKPWIYVDGISNIDIDHSMILMRCDFQDECRTLLENNVRMNKRLKFLLQCRQKWGVDIDINYIGEVDDKIFEVIHLEYDTYFYNEALDFKCKLEEFFLSCDIEDIAMTIKSKESEWSVLHGYHQNAWKANFLGLEYSEDTRKSI